MRIGACLTSERQNWKTPKRTYEELDKEFHFDYDPCPNDDSLVGFLKPWGSRSFLQPSIFRNCRLGKTRLRAITSWEVGGDAYSKQDRHKMVARLCYEIERDTLY